MGHGPRPATDRCCPAVSRPLACTWRPRAGARRARTQPEGRRRRHPARCAGGVLRRLRLGQIVARLRHPVRRGAAPLPRIGVALCAPPDRPGRRARRRQHRGVAAGGGPAAAARHAQRALIGRQRDDDVQPAAHAVFARRQLSAQAADAVRRGFLAQHAAGRLPALPWPGAGGRRHRARDGARRFAQHPRTRHRVVAAGLARAEPARHPGHAGPRRRQAVARIAEEGPRLDPLHRRNADGAGLRRLHAQGNAGCAAQQDGAQLHGHLHQRPQLRAAYLRHHAERADEKAGGALHHRRVVPGVPRQTAQAGGAVGDLRRAGHRRDGAAAAVGVAGRAGARCARGPGRRSLGRDARSGAVARGDGQARAAGRGRARRGTRRAPHAQPVAGKAARGPAHRA